MLTEGIGERVVLQDMRRLEVNLNLVDDTLGLDDLFGGTNLFALIELGEELFAFGP